MLSRRREVYTSGMSSAVPKRVRLAPALPVSTPVTVASAASDQRDVMGLAQGLARLVVLDWDVASDTCCWRSSPEWLLGPVPLDGGYPPLEEMVHPEDRAHFLRVRATEEEAVYRVVRTDGDLVWVAARAKVFRGPEGQPERVLAVLQDISAHKRVEIELMEQRERLRMVHELAGLHSVEWEVNEDRLIWNSDPEPILGRLPVGGRYPAYSQMVHPDDRELFLARRDAIRSGMGPTLEFRIIRTDGQVRWLSVRQQVFGDGARSPGRVWLAVQDISERERYAFLAQHDPVTGLPNRTLFLDRLRQSLARAARDSRSVAVMFLDLDRFKQVNDTLGHDMGDLLLQHVGARLSACLRKVDTVARLGGDEFTVIIEGFKEPEQVTRVAQKILAALNSPFDLDGTAVTISSSIGIALHPEDAAGEDELLKRADEAMYRAKQQRNGFRYAGREPG